MGCGPLGLVFRRSSGFLTSPTVSGRLSRFILHPDLPLVLVLFLNNFLLLNNTQFLFSSAADLICLLHSLHFYCRLLRAGFVLGIGCVVDREQRSPLLCAAAVAVFFFFLKQVLYT